MMSLPRSGLMIVRDVVFTHAGPVIRHLASFRTAANDATAQTGVTAQGAYPYFCNQSPNSLARMSC